MDTKDTNSEKAAQVLPASGGALFSDPIHPRDPACPSFVFLGVHSWFN
jgi:hypothetical protein